MHDLAVGVDPAGADGWTVHTIHNVWGFTSPGDKPLWGLFPMATPWLCQHLWEHYAFGGDAKYLRTRAYPLMKGAAEFCLDFLIEDKDRRLTTSPSITIVVDPPPSRFIPSTMPSARATSSSTGAGSGPQGNKIEAVSDTGATFPDAVPGHR